MDHKVRCTVGDRSGVRTPGKDIDRGLDVYRLSTQVPYARRDYLFLPPPEYYAPHSNLHQTHITPTMGPVKPA